MPTPALSEQELRAIDAYCCATPPRTKQALRDKLIDHKLYIDRCGEDLPEIRDWKWLGF